MTTAIQRITATQIHAKEWKNEFKDILVKVSPKLKSFSGHAAVDKPTATKIIDAFKKAGYKPYEQLDDFWVIETKKDESVGLILDNQEGGSKFDMFWMKED